MPGPGRFFRPRFIAALASRHGFTLIEVLVVIAIVAVTAGLVLPGVNLAREAGRRTQCQQNLRQVGLGFQQFEQSKGSFPASVSGNGARYYWAAQILPHIGEPTLAATYDTTVACTDAKNRDAVQVRLPLLVCPSTPDPTRQDVKFILSGTTWPAAVADYAGSSGPDAALWTAPAVVSYPLPSTIDGFFKGTIKPGQRGRRASDITDGMSKSVALVECAGRPQVWAFGRVSPDSGLASSPTARYVRLCGWADADLFTVKGFVQDPGQTDPGAQARSPGARLVNASNNFGIYGCHPGGAHVLLADGGTPFIEADIAADVVASLLTIKGGDAGSLP